MVFKVTKMGWKHSASNISATFDHPQIQQSIYWKRHKIFKTLGWTSLLAGVGGVGYGLFSDMSQDKAIGTLIGGGCLVLVCVLMFGLARSNKQKARSLSLQGRSLVSSLPGGSCSEPRFEVNPARLSGLFLSHRGSCRPPLLSVRS